MCFCVINCQQFNIGLKWHQVTRLLPQIAWDMFDIVLRPCSITSCIIHVHIQMLETNCFLCIVYLNIIFKLYVKLLCIFHKVSVIPSWRRTNPKIKIAYNYIPRCVSLHTLRPRNCRHFADSSFKCIFLNENAWISFKISLKFIPKFRIYNIPALVQIMAWRWPGDKPLSESMLVRLLTHMSYIFKHSSC